MTRDLFKVVSSLFIGERYMEISAAKCQDKSETTSASCSIIFIMATSKVFVDPSFAPDYAAGTSQ